MNYCITLMALSSSHFWQVLGAKLLPVLAAYSYRCQLQILSWPYLWP